MADKDADPAALEEERLMRAVSKKGMGTSTPKTVVKKAAEPAKEAPKKDAGHAGAVPKWKQAQLDRDAEEAKKREGEKKKKEDAAKVIATRVAEFGLGANQEDEKIDTYLHSPRGEAEKPKPEEKKFDDPIDHKPKDAPAAHEDDSYTAIPSYDERKPDERAAKEEERLMKMIQGKM